MEVYLQLKAWPDVPSALHSLRDARIELGILSNVTGKILDAGIRNWALTGLFAHVLSTDTLRTAQRSQWSGVRKYPILLRDT